MIDSLVEKLGKAFPGGGPKAVSEADVAWTYFVVFRSLNLRPLATSSSSSFEGLNCGP